MKEANNYPYHQVYNSAQSNYKYRLRDLEKCIQNQRSLISYDGLLDGIQALVQDCEPMKKNKNVDNFLSRCKK